MRKNCSDNQVQAGAATRSAACGYAACLTAGNAFIITAACDNCMRNTKEDRCCNERAKCAEGTACDAFAKLTWKDCADDVFSPGMFGSPLKQYAKELGSCLNEYRAELPIAYADFKAMQACTGNCWDACTRRR